MNFETYKHLTKNLALNYPRLRNGEYSPPYVKDLAKGLKMDIDADIFALLTPVNKDVLEFFAKKLRLQGIINDNLSFVQKKCPELPIEVIVNQKVFTKMDWSLIIYIVFSEPILFSAAIKELPEKIQKLWNALVWSKEFSALQVQDVTGEYPLRNLGKANTYSSKDILELLPEYKPFASEETHYYQSSTFTFSLPLMVRAMQKPYIDAPKESQFYPIGILPQELTIFENEILAIQDISRVLAYHSQGNIKTTTSGKPNISTVNKMRKALSLKEFYDGEKELETLRAHCLGNLILYVPMKQVSVGTAQIEILKTIVSKLEKNQIRTLSMTLPKLKGVHKLEEYTDTLKTEALCSVFKQLELTQWYTTKNLEQVLFYQDANYLPSSKRIVGEYVYFTENDERYSSNTYLNGDNYQKMYVEGYLKGSIFLFASLGVFDIAYTKPDTEEFGETFYSDWEGLEAFRITPLGAYLLGKTKEYEAPINEDSTELFFDENELIILGKSDDKLTDTLLLNYVQKAGASRYIVTSQSFLKDCKTPKQIKDKIALFKQTVGKSKLPDNWEAFFSLLQERSNNVVKTDDFQVFQLNATDKELIRLIAQEKSFQNIVFKAEGYKILVANDKVTSLEVN